MEGELLDFRAWLFWMAVLALFIGCVEFWRWRQRKDPRKP